jgi:hypothetical protein
MEILRNEYHEIATIAAHAWAANELASHSFGCSKAFGASVAAAYKEALATLEKIEYPPVDMQEGERYAGVVLNDDGSFSHHLILSAFKPETDLNWKDAMALGEKMRLSLPTKQESALLYANLQDQFDAGYWHWTSTQFSEDDAWDQYFDDGHQYYDDKDYERRCRFVRRISAFIL